MREHALRCSSSGVLLVAYCCIFIPLEPDYFPGVTFVKPSHDFKAPSGSFPYRPVDIRWSGQTPKHVGDLVRILIHFDLEDGRLERWESRVDAPLLCLVDIFLLVRFDLDDDY